MRNILLFVFTMLLLPPPVGAAEPSGVATPNKFDIQSKSLPVRSKGSANPCAAYGAGFAKVDGADTCVKIGGSVSVGVGASSNPR